jgi:DNA-binding beta-propeller fold protein YncE
LSHDGRTLWVACAPDSAVIEVDLHRGRVVRAWRVDGGSPWMFVVTPDESTLVITQFDAAKATVITRSTGARHIVPLSGKPMGVAAAPDGTEVWIGVTGTDSLYVLSTTSDSIIARFASAGHEPARIAFTPDGSRAVITASRSDLVEVYDRRLRAVRSSIPTGSETGPKGLVLSADGATAWVSLMTAGRLIAIDLPSTRVTESVTTGGSPERSAVTAR